MTYTDVHAAPVALYIGDPDRIAVASFQPPVRREEHR